ncbi:MAG: RING finger domain-containing protein, partial [Rectinemataceae bacterium]|nr:RING finger domain-containing protein [Rectinemataceae bacterium]
MKLQTKMSTERVAIYNTFKHDVARTREQVVASINARNITRDIQLTADGYKFFCLYEDYYFWKFRQNYLFPEMPAGDTRTGTLPPNCVHVVHDRLREIGRIVPLRLMHIPMFAEWTSTRELDLFRNFRPFTDHEWTSSRRYCNTHGRWRVPADRERESLSYTYNRMIEELDTAVHYRNTPELAALLQRTRDIGAYGHSQTSFDEMNVRDTVTNDHSSDRSQTSRYTTVEQDEHIRILDRLLRIQRHPDDDTCVICSHDADEIQVVLPCQHIFHRECIEQWVQQSATCPLCRASLSASYSETMIIFADDRPPTTTSMQSQTPLPLIATTPVAMAGQAALRRHNNLLNLQRDIEPPPITVMTSMDTLSSNELLRAPSFNTQERIVESTTPISPTPSNLEFAPPTTERHALSSVTSSTVTILSSNELLHDAGSAESSTFVAPSSLA